MIGPTHAQKRTLRFIADHIANHGYPPTLREMCAHFGLNSTRAISDRLSACIRKGLLMKAPGSAWRGAAPLRGPSRTAQPTARGYELLESGSASVTGAVTPESRCPVCNAATFAPERGCPMCRIGAAA